MRASTPPILQPAEPFLDLSGEDIRKRMFLTTDPQGRELCLRPDLTIPVSRDYLASDRGRQAGRLLLSRPGFPPSRATAPARIHAGRHRILRPPRHGGRRCRDARARARGDGHYGLGHAGHPHRRRRAVCRADRRARSGAGLEAPADEGLQPQDLARARSRSAHPRAPRRHGRNIRACWRRSPAPTRRRRTRWSPICSRSPASPPSAGARSARSPTASSSRPRSARGPRCRTRSRALIERFLAIAGDPDAGRGRTARARGRCQARRSTPRSTCSRAAPASSPRAASISARIRFSTAFGRGLDYYTGFVFELHDSDAPSGGPLVAGGRYDGLLTRLGSASRDPGGRLRGLDRAARRARSAA